MSLLNGIDKAAQDQVDRQFPGAQSHVLFWNYNGEELSDRVLAELRATKATIHLVSGMLDGFLSDEGADQYILSKHDYHPNALAHDTIAKYISENIVKR